MEDVKNGQFTVDWALGFQSITQPPQGFVRHNMSRKVAKHILYTCVDTVN